MRRSILIAVLAGALVGLAVAAGISLAGSRSGGSGESSSKSGAAAAPQGSFASAYAAKRGGRHGGRGRGHRGRHGHGHGIPFGPLALAFSGLAERLDVPKEKLHEAAKGVKRRALDRAVADGTISADERAALEACFQNRGGSGCDRAKARAAHRKLHRAFHRRLRNDRAGLKAQLFEDLAAELGGGKTAAQVEEAARAELVELLDTAVTMGFLSDRGRELALGCFDRPNECDLKALRAEVKKRFRGHRHGGRRGP